MLTDVGIEDRDTDSLALGLVHRRVRIAHHVLAGDLGPRSRVPHGDADARGDDELAITTWMAWVRGASLCMAYEIRCEDRVIASGLTEHAAVNDEGRVRRIPRPQRDKLRALTPTSAR